MSDENQEQAPESMDNRQFPRVGVSTEVKYAVVIPVYENGTSKDISQGGLCLETKKSLPQGSILRLEFDLPGDPPEHIQALGRVVWQRTGVEGTFSTGIKFLT
ncbi:MAG: PilZ domain-containing protein [Candidatus Omnitrophica bacterium]|nr:PilZ domain-containing protein [Candidatus Omnitrophota bacterium]MDD4940560.1 PilZ domain-containing protein [Candidatus Omnitrophota bacterium]MDD5774404.1 PilZ domain-containing protein [Candidatus Omnitrophota bacterium]